MSEIDDQILKFQITGEATRENLARLSGMLGEFGLHHFMYQEGQTALPSIGIDFLDGLNGTVVPAITEGTLTEFLVAEGAHQNGAKTSASILIGNLQSHVLIDHYFARVINPKKPQTRNFYRRECNGCPCPLRVAFHVGYPFEYQEPHPGGLDPLSFLRFCKLSDAEIRDKINGVGPGRLSMIRRLGIRIQEDLGIEVI